MPDGQSKWFSKGSMISYENVGLYHVCPRPVWVCQQRVGEYPNITKSKLVKTAGPH